MNLHKQKRSCVFLVPVFLVLCICVLLCGFNLTSKTVRAYTLEKETPAEYSFSRLDDTYCDVRIKNKSDATLAIIPTKAFIDGKEYIVKEIALNGFASSPNLKRISIPRSVERIGNMAFLNCTSLSKVSLANVSVIGNSVFARCPNLNEITIPKSVKSMGNTVFMSNSTQVRVRATKEEVENLEWSSTWNNNNEITEVEYNSTYIDELIYEPLYEITTVTTFGKTTKQTSEIAAYLVAEGQPRTEDFYITDDEGRIIIPSELNGKPVVEIKNNAFIDNMFQELIIEYSETPLNIQSCAFWFSAGEFLTINRPITFYDENASSGISENVFYESKLSSIILPDTITIIPPAAFYNCYDLNDINFITPKPMEREQLFKIGREMEIDNNINLPQNESLTIMTEAFAYTNLLEKLYIPHNVKTIESDIVFNANFNEINVDYIYEDIPIWKNEEGFHLDWLNGFNGKVKYKYRISFDANGGTVSISELQIWTGETISNLPIPILDGATFAGWYDEPDGNGELYENDKEFLGNRSVTLYAKWNVTITFDSDGGSACDSVTLLRGETVELPTPIIYGNGATFAGWYTSKDGKGTQYTSSTAVNSNITLYAKWNVTITFNSDGGSLIRSMIVVRGMMTPLPTPTLNGATFAGWYTSKSGEGTLYPPLAKIYTNITLYAKWNVTITFDSDGGSECSSITLVKGKKATLPTPTLNGATFAGWFTKKAGDGDEYTISDSITKSLTLYAKWNVIISFSSSGGSICNSITGVIGKSVILPSPTFGSRDGYWENNQNYSNYKFGSTFEINGTSNSFTAIWERYITFVQINGNNTANPSQLTLIKGDYWPTISIPTRRGYTNRGYYSGSNNQGTQYYNVAGQPLQTQFELNNDLTLYLTWNAEPYYFVIEVYNVLDSDASIVDSIRAEFEKEYEYTADESLMSQSGTTKYFSRWSIIRGTQDDFQVGTNEWIDIATGDENRTIKFSMKDFAAKYYRDLRSYETITIRAFYNESCVAEGTLITLADGSQKAVEELTGDEMLLVWNFHTGQYEAAPILFIDKDPYRTYTVIELTFSDGSNLKVISEHGLWDYDLNKYVYLDESAAQYIGHWFNKQTIDDEGNMINGKVELIGVNIHKEETATYSPVTYSHLCYFVNGMLSMPGGIDGLFNIFEVDAETMMYDKDAMENDIENYGLFTYEELAELVPNLTEEMFNAVEGQYLKIAIGKGMITIENIQALVNRYSFMFE